MRINRRFWVALLAAGMLTTGSPSLTQAAPKLKVNTDSTTVDEVGSYGMLPIYPQDIVHGTYDIDAQTTSTYFKLHEPKLTVDDEGMSVTFYIDSTSYTHVYLGTPEEARKADEKDWTPADVQYGASYFTIPVKSLDTPIVLSSRSKRRSKWYERHLLFLASSLPKDALKIDLPDYELIANALAAYEDGTEAEGIADAGHEGMSESAEDAGREGMSERVADAGTFAETEVVTEGADAEDPQPVSVDVPDGEYSIEVAMTGGSGRAMVTSPTKLTVKDGKAYATLYWSSSKYDYMILDGQRYDNEASDGGKSTFTLPVTAMDEHIDVIGDTTAMEEPVEIAYQVTFYEDTIGDRGLIPQVASMRVLITALIFVVAGGILNWFVKRRRAKRH